MEIKELETLRVRWWLSAAATVGEKQVTGAICFPDQMCHGFWFIDGLMEIKEADI